MKSGETSSAADAAPFLKWAGGKRQLLGQLNRLWPSQFTYYAEPFLGGGAVFFHLASRVRTAALNDVNTKVINLYHMVRDDVESVIAELASLLTPDANTEKVFYKRREAFNSLAASPASARQAALLLYLNRTCFNGLYRENRRGEFNVPFGRYKKLQLLPPERLRAASEALRRARVIISDRDFASFLLSRCRKGHFVYLDPPYVPLSETSYFTAYSRNKFSFEDQERLAETLVRLHERGVRWLLNNSFHKVTRELFVDQLLGELGLPTGPPYVRKLQARRNINCKADGRSPIQEYAIRNYCE